MQKRRKNRQTATRLGKTQGVAASAQKVFREDILELKYRFWIARAKFARGESSVEELRKQANALLSAVRERRNQVLGNDRRYRLNLSAAELIADPFLLITR